MRPWRSSQLCMSLFSNIAPRVVFGQFRAIFADPRASSTNSGRSWQIPGRSRPIPGQCEIAPNECSANLGRNLDFLRRVDQLRASDCRFCGVFRHFRAISANPRACSTNSGLKCQAFLCPQSEPHRMISGVRKLLLRLHGAGRADRRKVRVCSTLARACSCFCWCCWCCCCGALTHADIHSGLLHLAKPLGAPRPRAEQDEEAEPVMQNIGEAQVHIDTTLLESNFQERRPNTGCKWVLERGPMSPRCVSISKRALSRFPCAFSVFSGS